MKEGTGRYPLKEKYVYVVSLHYMFGDSQESIGSVMAAACPTFDDAVKYVLECTDDLIGETCACMDYEFKPECMYDENVDSEVFHKINKEHEKTYGRTVNVLVYRDPINNVAMVIGISKIRVHRYE